MLETNGSGILVSTNRNSVGRVFQIPLCCVALLGNMLVVADATEPTQTVRNTNRVEPLFSGRDFHGWIQGGNWEIANGAFYCSSVSDGRHVDLRHAKKLPGDCENNFKWKEDSNVQRRRSGVRDVQQMNPGLSISYNIGNRNAFRPNSSFGASMDYYVSGVTIRLHTRDLEDELPFNNMHKSGFLDRWPTKDFSAPRGEWNDSRIMVEGPEIHFWLNGNKAYDIDLRNKAIRREGRRDETIDNMNFGIDEWLRRDGLYLTVIAPYSDEFVKHHVLVRSLSITVE